VCISEGDGWTKDDNPELTATKTSSDPSLKSDAAPTVTSTNFPSAATAAAPRPKFIAPYKLLRPLGEGGMGQVWLAEQTAPVQRQVALKLIRVGVYDQEVLQRFRSERQSLAIMDHPAIAKVFDAGATPDGQPYFVMEYVPGVPITKYCDDERLTVKQPLELFIKVCEGVQHAHQKAIIHRDLKPRTFWFPRSMESRCRASSTSD
jgi:eukaryotic-like serine/threonine-protein kinase